MLEILREKLDPQQVGTPESVARQRRIADALLAQGSETSPIQSWTQGAARVAQALAGVYREHKADRAEKAGQASDKANLAALIGGAFGGGSAGTPIAGATAGAATAPVEGAQAAAPVQMAGDRAGKADQLFQYLKSKGATDNEALMLTGAANNESSYDPKATHDPKNGVPTGYGLWGHNLGRLDLRGKDMFGQADAALAELKNRPEAQMLATAKTPEEITRAQMFYERPRGFTTRNPTAGHNYSGRLDTLRGLYAKYGTGGGAPQAPAGVQVASADPNFAPQMPPQAPPAAPPMEAGAAVAPPGLGPMAAAAPPAASPGIPMPPVDPRTAAAPMAPPAMTGAVAPPAAIPPQAAAAMQGAPPGAKDSIVQMMIARGINPATGQPAPAPGIGRVVQALAAGGGAPQTVPAVSPAVQRVAGAMAPQAPPQASPAAMPAAPQGTSQKVALAVQALANPYASAASKMMAQKIISDEMESRDPLRQLQVQKLQLELGGGTDDEKRMRQLQIQTAEKGLQPKPPEYQVIGEDQFGNKQYGFVDPVTQKITPAQLPAGATPQQAQGDVPAAPPGVDPKEWRKQFTERQFEAANPSFDDVSGIRKEVQGLPSYKNFTAALPIYKSMVDTRDRDSKASDLNLVYGLGKIMDPTSVVREGEMVLVKDTASLPDWVVGAINGVNGGARLTQDTRKAILAEAYSRMQSYNDSFAQDTSMYRGIAGRRKIDPEDIIPNFGPISPPDWGQPIDPLKQVAPPAAGSATIGAPIMLQTPADIQRFKLPSGTRFQTPDGRIKVVP